MNSVPPEAQSLPRGVFSRMWSTFKSWPVGWKVVTICLLLLAAYAANRDSPRASNHSPIVNGSNPQPPAPNNPRTANASDARSQALAQLWAQHKKLVDWAQQCMAAMNQAAAINAQRA
ncbi:MAG TPA: hypothetical protein VI685_26610, partial [Candidatus Angelobacter sp.]